MQVVDTQRANNLAAVADATRPTPVLTKEEELVTLVLGSSQQQINLYKKFGDIQIVSTTTGGIIMTNYGYITNAQGKANFLVQRITSKTETSGVVDRWNIPDSSAYSLSTINPLLAKNTPLELTYSGSSGGILRSRAGKEINLRLPGGLQLTTTEGQVEILRALDTLRSDKDAKKLLNTGGGFLLQGATPTLSSYHLLQDTNKTDLLFNAPGKLISITVPINNQPVSEEEEQTVFALLGASSADIATYLKFGHLRKAVDTNTDYNIGETWSEKMVWNRTAYLFIANRAGAQRKLVASTFMTLTNYQTGEILSTDERWVVLSGQLSEDFLLSFSKGISGRSANFCPQWCMQYNPGATAKTHFNLEFKVAVPIEDIKVRLELMSAIRYIRSNKAVNDLLKPVINFTLDSFTANNAATPATYTYEITGGGKTLKFVSPGVFQGYK